MSLTLTPATCGWDASPSVEQSPVEAAYLDNARYMSATFLSRMQDFIGAAANHLDDADSSSEDFIRQWKKLFEDCLKEFGSGYGQSDSDIELTDSQATRRLE
jgi:hypothetical protein